jgi:transposase
MIRPYVQLERVFIYRKFVDFRKQVQGLSAIVQYTLELDPMSGDLYVFFNRRADKIRIIYWDANGYVLFGKYLEEDKFHLPSGGDDDHVCITGQQLNWLIDGININCLRPHPHRQYGSGHLKSY